MKSLGFTESEATIYLTSLEMGPASVQDIAKKAKVSRVTTYAVIESLTERGLMSSVEKGKKRLFVAESPERLVSFVTARVKEMETTLKEVQSSIDELKMIQRGEKPVVKMFEGPEALNACQKDVIFTKPKMIDEFFNMDTFRAAYSLENGSDYENEIKKFKPKTRSYFVVKGPEPNKFTSSVEFIKIPSEVGLDFTGGIVAYGNKVALSSVSRKQIAVIIESEEIANTVKALFDYIDFLRKK